MKKNLTQLISALLLSVFIVSCSLPSFDDTSKVYWIDNPLGEEITIKIDDQEHKIGAQSAAKIKVEYGTHELSYNGQKVRFIAKPCPDHVILNPTLSNYVSYAEAYYYDDTDAATKRGEILLNGFSREYTFSDGVTEKVPFRVLNSFVIEGHEGKWDYDLDTPFPEEVHKNVKQGVNLSAEIKIKIFREKEFTDYLGEEIGLRKPEITKLDDLAAQQIIDEKYLTFDCPQAQPIGDSLKVHVDRLYKTSGVEFSKAYEVFTSIDENRKNLSLRLFTPELRAACDGSNYMANDVGVSEALSNLKNINAWIVK